MTKISEASLKMIQDRIKGRRWKVYVCAEPDGQDCDSGTHPYILRHNCAALRRWHEAMEARDKEAHNEPGPLVVEIEVGPVDESQNPI